jgi:hypothetical protein
MPDDHAEVVAVECRRLRIDGPADSAEDSAREHDETRSVFVDEPAFDGYQPGFEQHEKRERPLDRCAIPSECLLDVGDEEGPAILVVGDHHHRGDANRQLGPAKRVADARRRWDRRVNRICHSSSRLALLFQ